jgi:hypothetical protein
MYMSTCTVKALDRYRVQRMEAEADGLSGKAALFRCAPTDRRDHTLLDNCMGLRLPEKGCRARLRSVRWLCS